jgi:hypothetical protein
VPPCVHVWVGWFVLYLMKEVLPPMVRGTSYKNLFKYDANSCCSHYQSKVAKNLCVDVTNIQDKFPEAVQFNFNSSIEVGMHYDTPDDV